MLKKRMWCLDGVAGDQYIGAVGEEHQLDKVENALFLEDEHRWYVEDEEILNPEAQAYELIIETGTLSPRRYTWKPLLYPEVLKEINKAHAEELPDDLKALLENLHSETELCEWQSPPTEGITIWITPLGSINWHVL